MRENLKLYLLLAMLFTSNIYSKTHTNKTFLSPRSHLDNMAMEYMTWHTQINKKNTKDFNGSIQATGFYQNSLNKSNIGQYFGYYAEHEKVIRDYISVSSATRLTAGRIFDEDGIKSKYLVHDENGTLLDFGGKVKINPSQESYGIRLDYHQQLKNFYFKVGIPLVKIKNNVSLSAIGELEQLEEYALDGERNGKTIIDYLKGDFENLVATSEEQQQKLTHAKIAGKKSASGIADINLQLGYNILNRKGNLIGAYVNAIVPTGNSPKAEYLFEPIYGNGDHFGLGAGVDSKFKVWNKEQDSIELLFNLKMNYLFESTEKRTVGLKTDAGTKIDFGHYYLGGKRGQDALFPLANALTQDLDIEPGIQFEALIAMCFKSENFTFDIGYNLFAKEGENVTIKKWNDTLYTIAAPDFDTTTAAGFNPDTAAHRVANLIDGPIEPKHLDLESVTSPTQVTHKIYGGLGYIFSQWKYPLMLGLGTSYEFVIGNSALEGYAIWGKVGVSF